MDHCSFDPVLGFCKADCCTVCFQEGGKGSGVRKYLVVAPQADITSSKGCSVLLALAFMRWCCVLSYS
jgi:hypothetical protein